MRCFLQTIDDKLIVLSLLKRNFFLEGENKGISSSTLLLLSCKLILLRGKKKLFQFSSGYYRVILVKTFKDTTVTLKVSVSCRIEKLVPGLLLI